MTPCERIHAIAKTFAWDVLRWCLRQLVEPLAVTPKALDRE